jgi:ATP-binding cassette subfamily F protein 3
VVSHDRDFLDGLVDKIYEFRNRKVREHLGGIYDFLQRRKLASLRDIERKDAAAKPASVPVKKEKERADEVQETVQETVKPTNKEQYEQKKEEEKKIRKIANRVKSLEHEIEAIENELDEMDKMLMNPDHIEGMQVYETYEQLRRKHDEALSSWEKQTELLETLMAKRK